MSAGALLRWPLLLFLGLPVVALVVAASPAELAQAWAHPMAGPAVALSLRTSLLSLTLIVAGGLPVAWWLARGRGAWVRAVETIIELPVVIPPAVVGVALLQAYGRQGLLGDALAGLGVRLPFSQAAVVVAQVMVAAPFFVQAATAGLRGVDPDLLLVARTLGASRARAFWRVAVPAAWPALVGGAALAWARALGEFGATLLFAGNLSGQTQTMPLAIFSALEVDLALARALALLLGGMAFAVLLTLRVLPAMRRGQ